MSTNFIVIADAGMLVLLDQMRTYLNGLFLCLYVNDVTPTHASAADSSWATEASFPGYARQVLDYGLAATNPAPPDADMQPSVHTFSCTGTPGGGPQTIYGWYVIDGSGNWVYASRTNRTPATVIAGAGDKYQVQPRLTGGVLASYP